MNRILNGQPHQVDGECTIAELIEGFGIPRRGCAVEENEEFVPRYSHDDYRRTRRPILEGEFPNGKTKDSTTRI